MQFIYVKETKTLDQILIFKLLNRIFNARADQINQRSVKTRKAFPKQFILIVQI